MGKRSNFEKNPRNYYRTFDPKAGAALRPYVKEGSCYVEPFAGAGDLIDQLTWLKCGWASDIEPQVCFVDRADAFDTTKDDLEDVDLLITNPPWDREYFEPILNHFVPMIDCWFLMSADWKQNLWAAPYVEKWLTDIVPIGRLKWIENSPYSAKDNCDWLKFSVNKTGNANFHPRAK